MLEIAERAPFFGVLVGLALLAVFMLARKAFRPRSPVRVVALTAAFAAGARLERVSLVAFEDAVFAALQESVAASPLSAG